MRHALILCLALFGTLPAFSFGYHPLVKQGKIWHCKANGNIKVDFVIDGDTVFNNTTYQKIFRIDSVGTENELKYYDFAIREDGHFIYRLDQGDTTEKLLYDFEFGVTKDEIMVTNDLKYIATDLVFYRPGEVMLRCYYCYPYLIDSPIQIPAILSYVEGIGNPDAVFLDPMNLSGPILQSCYEDDVLIYSRDNMFNFIMQNDGDVTNDGITDISDINAVICMMLGKDVQFAWDDVAGDLDNNLNIDIADVNAIIDKMLGKR